MVAVEDPKTYGETNINKREEGEKGRDEIEHTMTPNYDFSARWKCRATTGGPFLKTRLPRSVPGCAIYCGIKPLFGVSYLCTEVQRENERRVTCSGITIFPPGGLWIALALICIGSDPDNIFPDLKFPENEVLDIQKLDLADEVHELMCEHVDSLTYNPTLVAHLFEIFDDF
jgi:hypothetical protein